MLEALVDTLLLLGLLLVKGFFSGSEIALVNTDRLHLQHRAREGDRGAGLALRMLETPEVLLSTTLIGTNIATVTLVTVGTAMIIRLAGEGGDLYAFLVLTPLLLVFGEIVPKSVYQQNANRLAPRIIFPLWSLSLLLAPITWLFGASARLLARALGTPIERPPVLASKHMIRAIVRTSDRAAGVDVFDRKRIQRAMRFSDLSVSEIQIPLVEVPSVPASCTLGELRDAVRSSGLHTLLVHEADRSNVVGTVAMPPWELVAERDWEQALGEWTQPPLFVPETGKASVLVEALRQRDDAMAVVVGERGVATGVVTLGAIFAEVTGPMDSGFRVAPRVPEELGAVEELGEDHFIVGGRVPVQTLAELLDAELPSHKGRTVGGLMMRELSAVPAVGDEITVGDFVLTVVEASLREVRKVRVKRPSSVGETGELT